MELFFWYACFIQFMTGMARMAEEVAMLREESELLKQENLRCETFLLIFSSWIVLCSFPWQFIWLFHAYKIFDEPFLLEL